MFGMGGSSPSNPAAQNAGPASAAGAGDGKGPDDGVERNWVFVPSHRPEGSLTSDAQLLCTRAALWIILFIQLQSCFNVLGFALFQHEPSFGSALQGFVTPRPLSIFFYGKNERANDALPYISTHRIAEDTCITSKQLQAHTGTLTGNLMGAMFKMWSAQCANSEQFFADGTFNVINLDGESKGYTVYGTCKLTMCAYWGTCAQSVSGRCSAYRSLTTVGTVCAIGIVLSLISLGVAIYYTYQEQWFEEEFTGFDRTESNNLKQDLKTHNYRLQQLLGYGPMGPPSTNAMAQEVAKSKAQRKKQADRSESRFNEVAETRATTFCLIACGCSFIITFQFIFIVVALVGINALDDIPPVQFGWNFPIMIVGDLLLTLITTISYRRSYVLERLGHSAKWGATKDPTSRGKGAFGGGNHAFGAMGRRWGGNHVFGAMGRR